MGVERVDYLSEDEYRQALQCEEAQERQRQQEEQAEIEQVEAEMDQEADTGMSLRQVEDDCYREGMRSALRLYAWWKDGVQYVGSCGTTLSKALAEVDDKNKTPSPYSQE